MHRQELDPAMPEYQYPFHIGNVQHSIHHRSSEQATLNCCRRLTNKIYFSKIKKLTENNASGIGCE